MSKSHDVTPTGEPGGTAEIADFVRQMRQLAPAAAGRRGRLVFAMDATASRRPSWDRACTVQGEMFMEADKLGGLDVQLVFYRGFHECKASRWVGRSAALVQLMTRVDCRAGRTQIGRVLRHAAKEARARPVQALVFIGDCAEEPIDTLADLAGELGILGVRAFMFQEGRDAAASAAFAEIARLTRGAHCRFDAGSPDELRALLGAVAAYASGGMPALESMRERHAGARKLLSSRLA